MVERLPVKERVVGSNPTVPAGGEMRLRLLITEECDRNCEGCCNNDWDLDGLPVVKSFKAYEQVLITGGEPMLIPDLVIDIARQVRRENPETRIFVYTANLQRVQDVLAVLREVDGITVTLHNQGDVPDLLRLDRLLLHNSIYSLRLNVFKGVVVPELWAPWAIKDNIEWIENCPLPEGEVFGRWE